MLNLRDLSLELKLLIKLKNINKKFLKTIDKMNLKYI